MQRMTALLEAERREKDQGKRDLLITQSELSNAMECKARLEIRLNTMENNQRICNVRIEGKPEEEGEDLLAYVSEIGHQIGLQNMEPTDILSVRRLGKRVQQRANNRQKPRTIMINFSTVKARNSFFYARSNLKNVQQFRGIYLNDDVTPLTHKMRDDYRSVAALARNAGEEVRVHTDGIVLGGTKYLLSEPHTLPSRFSLGRAKTLEINDEIYFQSEHSYLSNFSPSHIVEDGVVYRTAEHFYQACKCDHANLPDIKERVISATTPQEAKRLADSIPETPEWRAARDDIMVRVINAKFDQNVNLANRLLKTEERPLNEATSNTHFGIGVGLHANEIREKAYRGTNKLGIILAAKRGNIKAAATAPVQPNPPVPNVAPPNLVAPPQIQPAAVANN